MVIKSIGVDMISRKGIIVKEEGLECGSWGSEKRKDRLKVKLRKNGQ